MKLFKTIVFSWILIGFASSGYAQIDIDLQPPVKLYRDSMEAIFLPRVNVKEYLDMLRIPEDTVKRKRHMLQTVGIVPAQEWISKRELKYLISQLRSPEKSNCVVMSTSAYLPKGEYTTIGAQVIHLLDAYRWNLDYPHFLHKCPVESEMRIQEIEAWWEVYGKKIKAKKIKLAESVDN